MNAFDGLNNEIRQIFKKSDKTDIDKIENYLSNKNLSEKYLSVLKSECNNMVPIEAFLYLLEKAINQDYIKKRVKGIIGLATLLNVSVKTAQKLKNSGIIDQAIIYEKYKLYFDEEEILKICLPKILYWKSFKLKKGIDQESIDLWEKYILSANMKKR